MITRQITEDWYNQVVVISYLPAVEECICKVQNVSEEGEVLKEEWNLIFRNIESVDYPDYPEHLLIRLTEEEMKELGHENTTSNSEQLD